MPKYDVTFKVEYTMEVEAETTALADAAARAELRTMDLGGAWRIGKIIRTDPPLDLAARAEAGEKIEDQADATTVTDLPAANRPERA